MARPLRLEFPGALYHVTARGNARQAIVLEDRDRALFLLCLGETIARFGWICHAYCLMDNHYHLLIETSEGREKTTGSGVILGRRIRQVMGAGMRIDYYGVAENRCLQIDGMHRDASHSLMWAVS